MSIPVSRLNHAVLFVRDTGVAAAFYQKVFGFEVVDDESAAAVFLRAGGGDNHHDLGLFSVGPEAPRPPRGSTGLYHLAWEVPTIEDLRRPPEVLRDAGALGGAATTASRSRCTARPRRQRVRDHVARSPRPVGRRWRPTGSRRSTSPPRSSAGAANPRLAPEIEARSERSGPF